MLVGLDPSLVKWRVRACSVQRATASRPRARARSRTPGRVRPVLRRSPPSRRVGMASVQRRLRVLTSGMCRPSPVAAPSTWEQLLAKYPDHVPLAPHAGWRDAFLFVNGVRLHYWRTPGGNRPDGSPKPVIVLSHGMGDNGLSWWYFLGELTDQFELVSIEARGHGLSDPPTDETPPDAQAEDIAAVIKELGLVKPIVMGHSMGSASTMWFAARYPDVSLSLSLALSRSLALSLSRSLARSLTHSLPQVPAAVVLEDP